MLLCGGGGGGGEGAGSAGLLSGSYMSSSSLSEDSDAVLVGGQESFTEAPCHLAAATEKLLQINNRPCGYHCLRFQLRTITDTSTLNRKVKCIN